MRSARAAPLSPLAANTGQLETMIERAREDKQRAGRPPNRLDIRRAICAIFVCFCRIISGAAALVVVRLAQWPNHRLHSAATAWT